MRLKQAWKLLLAVLMLGCWGGLQAQTEGNYQFTTVENDPLHVQMYTLDNGMQVFLSVNKSERVFRPISPSASAPSTTRWKPRVWRTISNT